MLLKRTKLTAHLCVGYGSDLAVPYDVSSDARDSEDAVLSCGCNSQISVMHAEFVKEHLNAMH